jgi:hypothetical protein
MAFVAEEVKVNLGPLSLLSTHAQIDTAGATQEQIKALYSQCAEILAAPPKAQAA